MMPTAYEEAFKTFDKQFTKVTQAATSVSGLVKMMNDQNKKARDLMADQAEQKACSKAFQAYRVAKGKLVTEIDYLKSECKALEAAQAAFEKAAAAASKKK